MRKIYSLIAFAAMMVVSVVANAQTMSEENAVLDEWGYRLEKNVDFVAGTVNGKDIEPKNTLTYSEVTEDFKVNSYSPTKLSNSGLEFMSIQIPGNGIDWPAGHGLRSTKNERWIVINGLRLNQIVAFEVTNSDSVQFVVNSIACNANTGWADTPSDPLIVEPISGSVHEIQEIAEEGSADAFRYFKVINNGPLCIKFNGKSAQEIKQMQIWSLKSEAEAVTAPIITVARAKGSTRYLDVKCGESTLGNECAVWYGIVDRGDQVLVLKDTEEIDHYDYTYNTDPETGDTLSIDSVAIYKQVLENGPEEAGEYFYDPEGGQLEVSANDDEDGDGFITLQAATVSSSGVFSEITELTISVEELRLNNPTVALVGLDGTNRVYKIGWTNNIKGDVPYTFVVEGLDGEYYSFEENLGVGEVFSIEHGATVTVSAEGYLDGVLDFAADLQDIIVRRKNAETNAAGEPIHDWNFSNLATEKADYITGRKILEYISVTPADSVAGTPADTLHFTVDEYESGEVEIPENTVAVIDETAGWWLPIANNRTTLNVVSDTLYVGEIYNRNENGYGYVKEMSGIFDGIYVDCAPNNKNNSTILYYTGKEDGNETGWLGVYFMARPTITFSPELVKPGEIVHIYYGQGGSNYTNTTTHQFFTASDSTLLSVQLPNNGVHVFYMDVFTYDDLPTPTVDAETLLAQFKEMSAPYISTGKAEDDPKDEPDAIKPATALNSTPVLIVTPAGQVVDRLQKGINIVKMQGGAVKKIYVK